MALYNRGNTKPRYHCPECGRKTLMLFLHPGDQDYYACTRCEFNCYTSDKATEQDKRDTERVRKANPAPEEN